MNLGLFVEKLSLQKALYKEMLMLSERQIRDLEASGIEAVHELARKKQDLMERIEQIEAQLQPFKRNWDEFLKKASPEQKTHAQALFKEIRDMLKELMGLEERSRKLMEKRLTQSSEKLKELWQKQQALKRYKDHKPSQGFFDKSGV